MMMMMMTGMMTMTTGTRMTKISNSPLSKTGLMRK